MTAAICPTCQTMQTGRHFCCQNAAAVEVEELRRELRDVTERLRQVQNENEVLNELLEETHRRWDGPVDSEGYPMSCDCEAYQ